MRTVTLTIGGIEMIRFRHIAILGVTTLLSMAALAGCQPQSKPQALTISQSEIQEMKSIGKLQGDSINGDLEFIAQFGMSAKNQAQRLLGTIVDVQSPVMIKIGENELWPYVPVVIRVDQADPKLTEETYTLRLFANSENFPDLSNIFAGQRVLAVGGPLTTDKDGLEVVPLGWLLEVADDGSVTDLNPNHELTGNFNDVADLLRMEPLN